jgi:hypothetical protein
MPDLSSLSDDELERIAGGGGSAPAPARGALADMSDDELERIAGGSSGIRDVGNRLATATGQAARLAVQGVPRALGSVAALVGDAAINTGKSFYNTGRRSVGKPEIDNPPLPLSNALSNSTERWADELGLPALPKEGVAGYIGRGLEIGTEALTGAGLANIGARGLRAAAPSAVRLLGLEAEPAAAGIATLAERPALQVAAGLTGQAASEGVSALAPDSPAARLIGAGLGVAVGAGTGVAIPAAGRFVSREFGLTKGARQARADATILDRAADKTGASLSDEPNAVPGYKPTAGQQSGDLGLLGLEKDVSKSETGQTLFKAREEEQAAAQNAAIQRVQPAGQGQASDLHGFVRGLLTDVDEAGAAAETTARDAARATTSGFATGQDGGAAAVGSKIRGDVVEERGASAANRNALYDAVDPNGTVSVTSQGLKEAARSVYGDLRGFGAIDVSPVERALVDHIGSLGPEMPFQEMVRANKAINAAKRKAGFGTPENERLNQLNSAVLDAMSNHAVAAAEADPGVASRIGAMRDELEARAGTAGSGDAGAVRSVQAGTGAQEPIGNGAGSGGPSGSSGTQGLPKGSRDRRKGLTLSQFIARNGGLALDDEAAARDFGNVKVPGVGGTLARPNGHSIDDFWRNKLIDEGYLPPDADGGASRDITKELYEALEREQSGRGATRTADIENRGQLPGLDDETAAHQAARSQVQDELRRAGIREGEVSSRALDDAAQSIARGDEADAITAYERAVLALDEPGPKPRPVNPDRPEPPGGFPNIFDDMPTNDPAAAEKYREARAAAKKHAETFKQGAPKTITEARGTVGNYTVPAEAVPRIAFRPRPEGAARIRELVAAGAKHEDLADAAAISLQKHITDGVLDPKGYAKWKEDHAGALAELPEDVRARFASASLAGEAVSKAAAARKAATKQAQSSALGRVAGASEGDVTGKIGSMLFGQNAHKDIGQLFVATRNNPEAREGLKRAVMDNVLSKITAKGEVGASGERGVAVGQLEDLLSKKRAMMVAIFGEDHVKSLDAVAANARQELRSSTAGVRPRGSPGTAAEMGAVIERGTRAAEAGKSVLGQAFARLGQGVVFAPWGAKTAAGGAGFFAGLSEASIGKLRAAGIRKVDDMVAETLLDPVATKAALVRGAGRANAEKVLVNRLVARSLNPAAAASRGDSE